VDDIDQTLERLRRRGAEMVGDVVQYKDAYRLCYIRGPEGFCLDSLRNSAERERKPTANSVSHHPLRVG
jgi:hypothetical protein